MKKSLVALAVLAASGAVLAQVTVKGNLTAGFKAVTTGLAIDGGVAAGASEFVSGNGPAAAPAAPAAAAAAK